MKNLVILISGRGSNMVAIADACVAENWGACIAAVISNRPDAAGLDHARAQGIPTAVVNHRDFDGREAFDAALAQRMSDRALKVISATDAGELLPRGFLDPAHFECRMCAWQDRCWRNTP